MSDMSNVGAFTDTFQMLVPSICTALLFGTTIIYAFLFWGLRKRLYFSAGIITLNGFVFVLAECLTIFAGWLNSPLFGRQWHRIEQLAGALFLFSVPYFISSFKGRNPKEKLIFRIWYASGAFFALAIMVIAFAVPDLFISQTTGPANVIPGAVLGELGRGASGLVYFGRDFLLAIFILIGLGYTLSLVLRKRDFRLFLIFIGLAVAVFGAFEDTIYVYTAKRLTIPPEYSFSRISVGMTIMLIFFLGTILYDFFATQKQLVVASKNLALSKRRYKVLSEGIGTAIFSLSKDLNFIEANDKAKQTFHLFNGTDTNNTKNIIEILHAEKNNDFKIPLVLEKLKALKNEGDSTDCKTIITDHLTGEPVECLFSFAYFIGEDQQEELIGKVDIAIKSSLAESIHSESLVLSIDNYITSIEHITSRLTESLGHYLNEDDNPIFIKMALQEMIMNSIEHGNLSVTFDEKTKAKSDGSYLELLRNRQYIAPYKDRKVSIKYKLTPDSVIYHIEDEGKGFNYDKIMNRLESAESLMLLHGRGILMTEHIFDKVEYSGKGNIVKLVKKFKKQKPEENLPISEEI